jgi:formyltetrahydrofolate hydrolase
MSIGLRWAPLTTTRFVGLGKRPTARASNGPTGALKGAIMSVSHEHSPEDLTAIGRDVESVALARAIKYHLEHRVLLNGNKTVVFR